MEFSNNLEYVTIFDKRSKVVTLATRLANLSAQQIKEFFANRENKIPRRLNMLAMMSVLNEKIKTLNSQSLPKDMFTKLQFYKEFNEFQLQSLFEKICEEEDFLNYRINLWTLIIKNYDCLNLQDGELQYLSKIKKLKVDDFSSYQRIIFEVCEDINKQFDGVPVKSAEEHFNNTFSSDELRRLAEKYGFIIPSRLKKNEFTDFVKQILKSKRKLTVALGKEIDEMTVVQLNSLCELHEITLSSNLKKHEIIYLLMFYIKANKLSTSELKGISNEGGIVPLEFTVNLDNIDNFGRGEAKEVIVLPKTEPEFVEEPEEPMTQEDLIKEIARKLGLIQDEEPAKSEVKEQPKPKAKEEPKPVKKAVESNGKMTPAERLALARKRKQELAEKRRLEEQGFIQEETPEETVVEEVSPVIEEPEEEETPVIDVQALISKLRSKNTSTSNENKAKEKVVEEPKEIKVEPEEETFVEPEEKVVEEPKKEIVEEFVEDDFEDDLDLDDVEKLDAEVDETIENDSTEEELDDEIVEPVVENVTPEEVKEQIEEPVIEETTSVEEEIKDDVVSEVVEQKAETINDESYDPEFKATDYVDKGEVISNPYYKNKKLNAKKKSIVKTILYSLGLIAVFCVGVIVSRFLK